jgi:hypothetical protein
MMLRVGGSRWRRDRLRYYGGVMTFLVPGDIGESFFQKDRLLFGILPFLLGIGILVLAGWFLYRSNLFAKASPRPRLIDVAAVCIVRAIGTIWQFFLIGSLLSK